MEGYMNKGLSKIILVTSVAVLLITALLVSGCAGNTAQTPIATTPTSSEPMPEFRIGLMGGQTGPAAAAVINMLTEIGYHFKYVNEVEGGINGIKLNWKVIDNKGNPEGAALAFKELRESFKPHMYISVEDYLFAGIKDQLAEDNAVLLTTSVVNPQLFSPPGRYFSTAMAWVDGFGTYIKWVTQDWKGTGNPKVGVLYYDLPSGLAWKPAESWVAKQNVDLVPVPYPYTSLDIAPQLLQLRDAGVNYIWQLGTSVTAPVAIKGMVGLGLTDKIKFTFSDSFESDVVLPIAGKDAAGFMAVRTETPFSDNTEATKLYSTVWKWAENKDKWSDNRPAINVRFAVEAILKQVTADVGKDKIDSVAVYNALNKLTNIDTRGNTQGLKFGPDSRIGTRSVKIIQVNETGTGTKAISEFITAPRIAEGVDK
jgi:branched-chain amino acid transport system substrate-binding protein